MTGMVRKALLIAAGFAVVASVASAGVPDPRFSTIDPAAVGTNTGTATPQAAATPGFDVIVRDVESGATGVRHQGFEVPKYDSGKLSTSTLVLATKLEGLGDQPAVGMFTIGNVKVIPNVSGTFHRGTPVGVYMQIYNAGIDQTTLRPSVDVEYALMKDGKELGKQTEDWRGNSDAGQRLTLARLIDSSRLAPGDYSVEVRVRDRVSGQNLTQTAKFSLQ